MGRLRVGSMTANGRSDPLGIASTVTLGWGLSSSRLAVMQAAYEIEIGSRPGTRYNRTARSATWR